MTSSKRFDKWKTIIIHNDSNKEIIRYDLDEKQRLQQKLDRQKKRCLMLNIPFLKDNKLKKNLISKMFGKRKKQKPKEKEDSNFIIDDVQNDQVVNIDFHDSVIIDDLQNNNLDDNEFPLYDFNQSLNASYDDLDLFF